MIVMADKVVHMIENEVGRACIDLPPRVKSSRVSCRRARYAKKTLNKMLSDW